jgi:pSer/pThr/pTyr-binding forkhead associated (FHA) protein
MQDQEETGGPLWTRGEMILKVQAAVRASERIVHIRRPFARLGRASGAEITIGAQAASDQHVYFHLDSRGVYAVDLDTRTGTRFSNTEGPAGWLRPGHWLEVAGRRVELLDAQVEGTALEPQPCDTNLLAATSRTTLVGAALEPLGTTGSPWVLNSELVFMGRSAACGIPIRDRSVARTHAALLRTETAAYVIDLSGHQTWIDDRPVRGAAIIHNGQVLTLGSARFIVSIEPATRPASNRELAWVHPTMLETVINPETSNGSNLPAPLATVAPESERALLAWFDCDLPGLQHRNAHAWTTPPATLRSPTRVTPLCIARTTQEQTGSLSSTTWLLKRLSQVESQNRSAWRAFLDRLVLRPRRVT